MLYLCAKGSAFGCPLKKWTKIQFTRIYFFFGEEKENAKKEGTHRWPSRRGNFYGSISEGFSTAADEHFSV